MQVLKILLYNIPPPRQMATYMRKFVHCWLWDLGGRVRGGWSGLKVVACGMALDPPLTWLCATKTAHYEDATQIQQMFKVRDLLGDA
jgi:hypothetical protein